MIQFGSSELFNLLLKNRLKGKLAIAYTISHIMEAMGRPNLQSQDQEGEIIKAITGGLFFEKKGTNISYSIRDPMQILAALRASKDEALKVQTTRYYEPIRKLLSNNGLGSKEINNLSPDEFINKLNKFFKGVTENPELYNIQDEEDRVKAFNSFKETNIQNFRILISNSISGTIKNIKLIRDNLKSVKDFDVPIKNELKNTIKILIQNCRNEIESLNIKIAELKNSEMPTSVDSQPKVLLTYELIRNLLIQNLPNSDILSKVSDPVIDLILLDALGYKKDKKENEVYDPSHFDMALIFDKFVTEDKTFRTRAIEAVKLNKSEVDVISKREMVDFLTTL